MHGLELSAEAQALVRRYADGLDSAEAVAYELWRQKLTPEEPDPRAADVIYWSKELGWGIPSESAEEAWASMLRGLKQLQNPNRDRN